MADPLTLLGTGAKIISGLGSIFGGSKQQTTNFSQVRKSAEKAGINPLTALGANQTSFTSPLVGGVNGFNAIGEALIDHEQRETAIEMAERELDAREKALTQTASTLGPRTGVAAGASALVDRTVDDDIEDMTGTGPHATMEGGPLHRPTLFNQGMTPVYMPNGNLVEIPKPYADRLKLKNFDPWIGEDAEALASDLGGALITTPIVGDYVSTAIGGLSGKPMADRHHNPSRGNGLTDNQNTRANRGGSSGNETTGSSTRKGTRVEPEEKETNEDIPVYVWPENVKPSVPNAFNSIFN